jgi:hypothetical protein
LLEARFSQLASRPGCHAQHEPLTRLQLRLAPIPPDRVDAVPRAPTSTDAAGGTNAATRRAAREQLSVDGRRQQVVERFRADPPPA